MQYHMVIALKPLNNNVQSLELSNKIGYKVVMLVQLKFTKIP